MTETINDLQSRLRALRAARKQADLSQDPAGARLLELAGQIALDPNNNELHREYAKLERNNGDNVIAQRKRLNSLDDAIEATKRAIADLEAAERAEASQVIRRQAVLFSKAMQKRAAEFDKAAAAFVAAAKDLFEGQRTVQGATVQAARALHGDELRMRDALATLMPYASGTSPEYVSAVGAVIYAVANAFNDRQALASIVDVNPFASTTKMTMSQASAVSTKYLANRLGVE
ncbi:hypothetical protein BH09PSE6_BH09PSE6_07180 [soil metagenome]